jgi:alpha-L-arabinofuranosidase
VKGDDGRTRIAVVQKDETAAAPVHLDIAVDGRARSADVLRLTGDTLGGEATAVQGATVDRQGNLKPKRADQVRVRDGRLGVDVAAGSAVVITLDGC